MTCPECSAAADTRRPELHRHCSSKTCPCQHHEPGYGKPVPSQLPAEKTPAPAVVELDEWERAALDSVGLTLDELRGKIQNWSADGSELLAWRVVMGEAA